MNKNTARVLHGFFSLNHDEQKEVIEEIERYQESPDSTEHAVMDSINEKFGLESSTSISLGPSPNSCPCCGS